MKGYTVVLPVVLTLILSVRSLGQVVPDSIFRSWEPEAPGGVACVVEKGKIVFRQSFGFADVDHRIPNSTNLKYDLASNAKQFTAMGIALLEEQGKISANDPLRKYYPGLHIKDDVRIKNLIDHTSGLRDASVLAALSGKVNLKGEVRRKFNTKEYYIQCLMSESDLGYPPGQEMAYNNFNYVLLGDIIEKVSGQSLASFLDSAVFKPLGMKQTFLRDQREEKFENEALGYLWNGRKYKRVDAHGGIVGDHNLVSTVDDLVRWQMNFFNNQLGNKSADLIARVSTATKLNDGTSSHYGYGLFDTEYKGVRVVHHGGDDGRQTSMLLRFPDHDLSVIVLANSSRYNVTEKIAFQLAEVFLKASLLEQPGEVSNTDSIMVTTVEPDVLKKHVGLYTRVTKQNFPQMIRIKLVNGQLVETWGVGQPDVALLGTDNFHFIGKTVTKRAITIQFEDDETGMSYQFHKNEPVSFKKVEEVKNPLRDYRGRYRNGSTGAAIKVKSKRGELVARKGIIRLPMIDFARDQFYAYNNDALFTFVRDNRGMVTSVRVDAPDFRNFWFVKK